MAEDPHEPSRADRHGEVPEQTTALIPDNLRPNLDEIAARLLSGHAAVMVGSGFSRNAAPFGPDQPFPDWPELGNRFYKELHGRSPDKEHYLQVPTLAHEIVAAFGRPKLNQMLRDAIPDLMHEPSQLHIDLLNLPWSDVLTTNYDTLLERACRSIISRRYNIVVNPENLGDSKSPRIIKLHGTLPTQGPFIVTDEDYRRYPADFAPFVTTAIQTLLENTLCLIGFSGDDPNFLQWIGWIRDQLGPSRSRKMYLVGVLSLSTSQRMLLEKRKIVPVDMSECPGVDRDHYRGLKRFLDYLAACKREQNSLMWPRSDASETTSHDQTDIASVVADWKKSRVKYPGWVVVPEDRRSILWHDTRPWIDKIPLTETLPSPLDFELAFELTWRTEKCLAPIFDNHADLLTAVLDRYWPEDPTNDTSTPSGHGYATPNTCHHLLLWMMRYYREEGLKDEWNAARARIMSVEDALSADATARFHYEQAMFALFTLNPDEVRRRVEEWRENDALPFWNARKAAVMAEIGLPDEAERLLERSLEGIRTKSNLLPTHRDYSLASQESYVMFLLQALRYRRFSDGTDGSEAREERRDFTDRWHALREYKCDPWHEFEHFRHKLQGPPKPPVTAVATPSFDIGHVIRKHSIKTYDTETLYAYNFLRFCEDGAVPLRTSGVIFAERIAKETLPRIADHASYWALATLVRIGDVKAVGELFDRSSLSRMDSPSVDGLVASYLGAIRRAESDIESATPFDDHTLGSRLAQIVPEVLSRLCSKCSYRAKKDVVDFLLGVYQSKHRVAFGNIRRLTVRLMGSLTTREQIAMVPKLLRFSAIGESNHFRPNEFVNPLLFCRSLGESTIDGREIHGDLIPGLLDKASSEDARIRRWAVTTLDRLYEWGMLNEAESASFGRALWRLTDDSGMPTETDFRRWAFLELPHPEDVDPVRVYMEYIRAARFPAQRNSTKKTISLSETVVELCNEIVMAAQMPWTASDIRAIVHRLINWWEHDRDHLRRATVLEGTAVAGFLSAGEVLRKRVRQLARTLAIIVGWRPQEIKEDGMRRALRGVIEEMSEDDIPKLVLEMACSTLFPRTRRSVLREIENHNASTPEDFVVDGLSAIQVESERLAGRDISEEEHEFLKRLVHVVGESIRWRDGKCLVHAMGTMGVLIEKHRWDVVDEVEQIVLFRLGSLVDDTALHGSRVAKLGHGEAREEIATKSLVRRETAALAYRLFEAYRERGVPCPQEVMEWEKICRSENEFAEIRCQWITPRRGS